MAKFLKSIVFIKKKNKKIFQNWKKNLKRKLKKNIL